MAPQHTGPQLFEVIRRRSDGRGYDRSMQVPDWWSQSPDDERRRAGRTHGWLTTPVRLHLNRAMLLGAVMVVGAMVVIGYQFGRADRGPDQPLMAAGPAGSVRDPAPREDAARPTPPAGPTEANPPSAAAAGVAAASGPVAAASFIDRPERVAGYNYFCLATMPTRYRDEAERSVAFLHANGVDAAVFQVQNRWLQVVAMRGFARTTSSDARDYENLLRSLGRVWKAERRGWSDWSDLYAIKHRG